MRRTAIPNLHPATTSKTESFAVSALLEPAPSGQAVRRNDGALYFVTMATPSKHSFRSRLAQTSAERSGPAGIHKNPGDFTNLCGVAAVTRQEFLRKHWEYLPAHLWEKANSLTTQFRGVAIDQKSGQFAFDL